MARRNGYRVRWRNSDWKTLCGAEADPEKVPDTFSLRIGGPRYRLFLLDGLPVDRKYYLTGSDCPWPSAAL
jgi:hypothetical protein